MPEVERHFSIDENFVPSTLKKSQQHECIQELHMDLSAEAPSQIDTSEEEPAAPVPHENEDFLNIFTQYDSEPETSTSEVFKSKKQKVPSKVEKKIRCNECRKAMNDVYIGCLKCQRFYLCVDCSSSNQHTNHPLIYHKFQLNEGTYYINMLLALQSYRKTCRYGKLTRASFVCDKCHRHVNDERFYAVGFDDYDLCKECFQNQDEASWVEAKAYVKIVPSSSDREMAYEFNRLLDYVKKKFNRTKGFIKGVKIQNLKQNDIDSAKSRVEQLENELDILLRSLRVENTWVIDLESRCNSLTEHRLPEKPPSPVKKEPVVDEANKQRTLEELGMAESYDNPSEDPDPDVLYDDQIRDELFIIDNDRKRITFLENQLNLYKAKYGSL